MGRKNASRNRRRTHCRKVRQYNARSRLFNGNVRSPGEFIFIWALIFVFIIGMGIFCISLGWHGKGSYEYRTERFVSSYRKNDVIVLETDGGEYSAWASLCDKEAMLSLKEGSELSLVTAGVDLLAAECGGKTLLDLSDSERKMREDIKTPLCIFGILALAWAVYVAVSVYVMCSAEKFPRLIRIFVKPEYLTRPPHK
ncbi:MAG: hypothetical protein ACI4XA_01715 [Oscillospiraceae bacterium]